MCFLCYICIACFLSILVFYCANAPTMEDEMNSSFISMSNLCTNLDFKSVWPILASAQVDNSVLHKGPVAYKVVKRFMDLIDNLDLITKLSYSSVQTWRTNIVVVFSFEKCEWDSLKNGKIEKIRKDEIERQFSCLEANNDNALLLYYISGC